MPEPAERFLPDPAELLMALIDAGLDPETLRRITAHPNVAAATVHAARTEPDPPPPPHPLKAQYVALEGGRKIVAIARSEGGAKKRAVALGVLTPLVVPGSRVRRESIPPRRLPR